MPSRLKEMLFVTRRGLLFLLLVFCSIAYGVYKLMGEGRVLKTKDESLVVAKENVYVFSGAIGPQTPSKVVAALPYLRWETFSNESDAALAVLLTDTTSCWLGLAQGLSNIGIPFSITRSAAAAAKHKVVMVYPVISGKVMSGEDLRMIAAIPDNGGTLIACNVYGGGMGEVIGYKDIAPSAKRTKFTICKGSKLLFVNNIFKDLIDNELLIAGKNTSGSLETVGYTGATNSIIDFEDGNACMVYKKHGKGRAYAIGWRLIFLLFPKMYRI